MRTGGGRRREEAEVEEESREDTPLSKGKCMLIPVEATPACGGGYDMRCDIAAQKKGGVGQNAR